MVELADEVLAEAEMVRYLISNNYRNIRMLDDKHWVATSEFAFTSAIIVGLRDNYYGGYEDRWCYHTMKDAEAALKAWKGPYRPFRKGRVPGEQDEPRGWHRHPTSGRRYNEFGELYTAL